MDIRGTNYRQVAHMQFAADEAERMSMLDTFWIQTMDLKHQNLLAYQLDIMVEEIGEVCQRKYVDITDFFPYTAENGSEWMISKNLQIQDLDEFFKMYLYGDMIEEVA